MSEHLEQKAAEAIDNAPIDKELGKIIKEEYSINNRRQIAFIVEYVKNGGNGTKAYKEIYGAHINDHSAAVLACKILKKVDISIILQYMGHGIDAIKEVLDLLKTKDPANYMKYISMFNNWDKQKVEHSGTLEIPVINIVSKKE